MENYDKADGRADIGVLPLEPSAPRPGQGLEPRESKTPGDRSDSVSLAALTELQEAVATGKDAAGIDGSLADGLLQERQREAIYAQDRDLDQEWFWTPEWREGEQDASDDITRSRVTRYPSAESFLASIGFGPLKPQEASIAVQAAIQAVEAHRFAEHIAPGEPVPRPEPDTS